MSVFTSTKRLLLSIILYPIFMAIYSIYYMGQKVASLLQQLFTLVYVEQLCGFKRKDKIVAGVNAFDKVPEQLVLAYRIQEFFANCENGQIESSGFEQKIIHQHLDILTKIDHIKTITIYLDSQSPLISKLITTLQHKLHQIQTQKLIQFLHPTQLKSQHTQLLTLPCKTHTPFFIVFSNYDSVCNIPAKYLVNAEIAFNYQLFASTNYDIYRAFAQYAESKQRNGK